MAELESCRGVEQAKEPECMPSKAQIRSNRKILKLTPQTSKRLQRQQWKSQEGRRLSLPNNNLSSSLKKSSQAKKELIIDSAYFPGEEETLSPESVEKLVHYCKRRKSSLVIGCDANARHTKGTAAKRIEPPSFAAASNSWSSWSSLIVKGCSCPKDEGIFPLTRFVSKRLEQTLPIIVANLFPMYIRQEVVPIHLTHPKCRVTLEASAKVLLALSAMRGFSDCCSNYCCDINGVEIEADDDQTSKAVWFQIVRTTVPRDWTN
ncbi:hypothetical protein J6590_017833 [Homalodisca vitripennis]|nr:hypothetical protein J6590_017833 [Homalodisca vitripennis]